MSNLGSTMKRQNAKNFKDTVQQSMVDSEKCNCKDKNKCPLDGVCKTEKEWFTNEVKDGNGRRKDMWKKRWYNHKSSVRIESHRNCTRLASHLWELKEKLTTKSLI